MGTPNADHYLLVSWMQKNDVILPFKVEQYLFLMFDKTLMFTLMWAGLYRTERDKGTLYELFFAKEDSGNFHHVTLFRPFGPLMKVRSTSVETSGVVINIIVPLAGRTEAFSQFLHNFRSVVVSHVKMAICNLYLLFCKDCVIFVFVIAGKFA